MQEMCKKTKTAKYLLIEVFEQGANFIDEFHNSNLTDYTINTQDLSNDEKIARRIIPIIETENKNPSYVFGMNSPTTLGIAIITEYLDTHIDNLMFKNISMECSGQVNLATSLEQFNQ
ncbi:hypothetical protein GHNINEIG_02253 [Hydrogenovibrio crunogenus]|uniref:Uncharacterized protein n=1 Tax=Hydrogenovibrio crunogenus TaxID=39765 RepID=A0A4P7P245_9GAMM|nr:hypothetical protein [Hydrogenovibrio crunogenus]QBZ84178.1 hypothetical protein GHNINEIG_02253 [Hydrogenovibrio crunogenus]